MSPINIPIEKVHNPLDFLIKEDTSFYHNWTHKNLVSCFANSNDIFFQDSLGGACVQYLPWDTSFFGFKIGKVVAYGAPTSAGIEKIINTAYDSGFKYLFIGIDCQNKHQRIALQANGFNLIETRLTYWLNLHDFNPTERFKTRLANPSDVPSLSAAAAQSVNEHDRFHADPIFTKNQADAMMAEWVKASITTQFADGAVIVDNPAPGAFCTFKTHKDHWDEWKLKVSQPVFSAVSRDFKGWYIKIISELSLFLKEQNADYSYLITQNTNRAVIKSWERLGYRLGSSDYVFSKDLRNHKN